jgi:hypothetical protein
MKIHTTLLSLLTALLVSCTPSLNLPPPRTADRIMGRVSNGMYYDATNTFCVPVLKNAIPQLMIEEFPNSAENASAVLFCTDFGQLERTEVLKNAKANLEKIAPGVDHTSCFFEHIYDTTLLAFPGTKVMEKRYVQIDNIGTCCCGILFIPGGSTLCDTITKKRLDSTRAYVISYADENLVIISVQEIRDFRLISGMSDDEANDRLINQALEVRKGYRNL